MFFPVFRQLLLKYALSVDDFKTYLSLWSALVHRSKISSLFVSTADLVPVVQTLQALVAYSGKFIANFVFYMLKSLFHDGQPYCSLHVQNTSTLLFHLVGQPRFGVPGIDIPLYDFSR